MSMDNKLIGEIQTLLERMDRYQTALSMLMDFRTKILSRCNAPDADLFEEEVFATIDAIVNMAMGEPGEEQFDQKGHTTGHRYTDQ